MRLPDGFKAVDVASFTTADGTLWIRFGQGRGDPYADVIDWNPVTDEVVVVK